MSSSWPQTLIDEPEAAQALLARFMDFHDWFLLEFRALSNFRFSPTGVEYPPGRNMVLRLTDGRQEVSIGLQRVSRFELGSEDGAILNAEVSLGPGGEVHLRFDDIKIIAGRASWWAGPFSPGLKFGPAPLAGPWGRVDSMPGLLGGVDFHMELRFVSIVWYDRGDRNPPSLHQFLGNQGPRLPPTTCP